MFGYSVAASGTTVVIGAPGSANQAFVFSAATGTLVATLAAPANIFGASVAISGTTVVVGAGTGEAYVFATTGVLVATLAKPTGADWFGISVAVSGTTVVVGALASGQAYLFSATTGAIVSALATPAPTIGDEFGVSVAVSGTTLVVGAPDDSTAGDSSGRAYVYNTVTGALIATLSEPVPADSDTFGHSVAVSGTTVVVGAPGNSVAGDDSGRAYVYDAATGKRPVATLTAPTPVAQDVGFGAVPWRCRDRRSSSAPTRTIREDLSTPAELTSSMPLQEPSSPRGTVAGGGRFIRHIRCGVRDGGRGWGARR